MENVEIIEGTEKENNEATSLVSIVNRNLQTKIEPQMEKLKRVYGFEYTFKDDGEYFDTQEELDLWRSEHKKVWGCEIIVEYLGEFGGHSDVLIIKQKGRTPYIACACDRDGYGTFNISKSNREKTPVWDYNNGSIASMYAAFRDRGIVFQDDIYDRIDKTEKRLLEKMSEIFNSKKQ